MEVQLTDNTLSKAPPVSLGELIKLPAGLSGFPETQTFSLLCTDDYWPYYLLRPCNNDQSQILVIEPGGWVPGYSPMISKSDANWLDIYDSRDALFLNLINIVSFENEEVYIDLKNPIVLNRNNLVGRQLTLKNAEDYSNPQRLIVQSNAV
ncbi:MAG: flagellar assembly protein FliW [Opitutaceae bacterium]|nr:flagellar assembly protein FliW [Opitutaceae bacterium]